MVCKKPDDRMSLIYELKCEIMVLRNICKAK